MRLQAEVSLGQFAVILTDDIEELAIFLVDHLIPNLTERDRKDLREYLSNPGDDDAKRVLAQFSEYLYNATHEEQVSTTPTPALPPPLLENPDDCPF